MRKFSRRLLFGRLLDRGRKLPAPPTGRENPALVVRLRTMACIAFRGQECSACVDACPAPGAIELESGRPIFAAELCTGCGDCVPLCPAPVNALQMTARDQAEA